MTGYNHSHKNPKAVIPASQAQLNLIAKLLGERIAPASFVQPTNIREASKAIEILFCSPRKPTPPPPDQVPQGYYLREGHVYKVVEAKNAPDKLYAKRLQIGSHGVQASWKFAPGVLNRLQLEDALTVEAAAEMGHLHGICMICGRTLTCPKSVTQGIGPVCIKRIRVVA